MSESEYVDYNGLVELARQTAIEHAKGWIPKLCEALKRENPEMSKEDIRETVANDCADFWSKATIRKFMPDEYKNEAAAALAKKKHEKDRLLSVTGDGQQFTNENTAGMNPAQEGSVSPTGQESTSFENTDRGPDVKPVAQTVNKLQNELKNVREVLESQIQSSS